MAITLPDSPDVPAGPAQKPSIAESFKPSVQPIPQARTAVDRAEEAIGRPIQSALNSPLGIVLNPAMQGINAVYKRTFEPAFETLSGYALEPEVARRYPNLDFEQVRKVSRDYANEISVGQSFARLPFEYMNLTSDALPEFMQEDFDILDQEDRDIAYKSQFAGWAASSALDIGKIVAAEKGFGPVWRGGKGMVLGRNTIRNKKDLEKYMLRLDKAEKYFKEGNRGPRSGDVRLIQQLVESKDPLKIAKNPLMANGSVANPDRAIAIVSNLDDATSVINYLRAERGNRKALNDLWKAQPLAADAVDDFGVRFTPLDDMSQIHALPSVQRSKKLQAVYADWTKKNPQFARAIDDFITEVESGAGISTYTTRRSIFGGAFDALADRATVPRGMRKTATQFGFVENDGVFARLFENGPFQRAVRVIYSPSRARRRAEINISNPRQMETAWQIASELNRVRALGTPEGARFKQNAIRRYMRAATDTERQRVFEKIEQGTLLRIARAYGVEGMTGSTRSDKLLTQMDAIYKSIDTRRTNIQRWAEEPGVWPDADGTLNVTVGPKLRSTEPSSVVMLDLAGLERATISNVRDAYKRSREGGWTGKTRPSAGTAARARMGDFSYGAGQFFDMVNIFFSNNVLLRVAYIPPNVIIDPILRATMDTESLFMTRNLFPGLANSIYNNTQRVANGVYRARTYRSKKEAKKQFEGHAEEQRKKQQAIAELEEKLEQARKKGEDVTKREERLIKKRAELARFEKRTEKARKEYLRYTTERGRRKKNRAAIGTGRQAVIRRRDGSPFPRLVAEDRRWEFEVDGQKFDVLDVEDPSVKGVRPYQQEYDAYNSFLAASRTSEARDRLRLRQGELDEISPEPGSWQAYVDAVTRLANRNFRNELDEVGGLILRGASAEDILRYLDSPDGAEYRVRILDMLRGPKETPDGRALTPRERLVEWVDDTIEQADLLFPDPAMRKTILDRDITVEEVSNYLQGRDRLPKVMGRKLELQTKNWRDYTYRFAGNVQDAVWKGFGALETRISRSPLFRYYVREEMKLQIAAAKRAGVKVDNSVVHDRIRQIAYRRSLARVENTMYSVRNLTNAGYMARYLMAFPQAFFNSQIVAARLLWKNPANALYYQSVFDMWDGFNPIIDDQGNEYENISDVPNDVAVKIAFPMQDVAGPIGAMGGAFGKLVASAEDQWYDKDGIGGTYINPRMMEFMVGDPSISWFANIGLSQIVSQIKEYPFIKKNGPEIAAWMRENLGDDVYERSIFYGGEPLDTTDLIETGKKALTSGYQLSLVNTASMAAGVTEQGLFTAPNYAARVSAVIKMDAEDAIRQGRDISTPEQVVKAAVFSEFIRSVMQFGWYPNIIVDTRTSAMMRLYGNLLEQYDDGDQAERELIRLVGVPGLAQLASTYDKTAGTPSSMKSVTLVKEEEQVLREIFQATQDVQYAGFMFQNYGEEEDEYVGEARAALRSGKYPGTNEPFLDRRDGVEIQQAALTRVGWAEFDALKNWQAGKMAEYGITSTQKKRYVTSGLKEEYNRRFDKLRENRPWSNAYNQRREDFWDQTVRAMTIAVEDDGLMRRQRDRIPILPELRTWLDNMILLKNYYEETKNTASTKDNTRAKDAMLEWHYTFVNNASPEFQEFSSRWLTMPEEDDQVTQEVAELMGVG